MTQPATQTQPDPLDPPTLNVLVRAAMDAIPHHPDAGADERAARCELTARQTQPAVQPAVVTPSVRAPRTQSAPDTSLRAPAAPAAVARGKKVSPPGRATLPHRVR